MAEHKLHYRRKLQELTLLFEISQTLDQGMDLDQVILPVLKLIKEHIGLNHGTVTLLNRQTGIITVEAAFEIEDKSHRKIKYNPGEGITGKVVQTGKPMIIDDIRKDEKFLNKTGIHGDDRSRKTSFICVPIMTTLDILGALSADREDASTQNLDEDVRLLSIVASMIAQAVRLRRQVQEEREKLLTENRRLKDQLEERFRPKNIIGNSTAMKEVFNLMAQVAGSEATVIIRGESGTGKELIAQAIHYNSPKAKGPFVKVNCSALPEAVIESELFGHEKGAFTGAVQTRKGRFEMADGGTIFLDEIGDLPLTIQVKLLRVLQEREFEKVGGNTTQRVNVRIITATHRNLEEMIQNGGFREDLYYRLNVFPIHVPPLRDRKSDITLLADYFTERYAGKSNKRIRRISTPAIELLAMYHWPGNVRELENCIERAVLLSTDGVIHGHHLPPTLQSAESTNTRLHSTLQEELENFEKELILDALKSSKGNAAGAARNLGLTERIMGLRIDKYGIDPKRFRS